MIVGIHLGADMNRLYRYVTTAVLLLALLGSSVSAQGAPRAPDEWVPISPEFTLYIEVPQGMIAVALSEELAQRHVAQVKDLVRRGFYDGLHFYRVVSHVAQGGAYLQSPAVAGAPTLLAEFDEPWSEDIEFVPISGADQYGEQAGFINGFPAKRSLSERRVWITGCTGVMGLARGEGANTAATDFAISQQPTQYNDRNQTNFGRVVWGMEFVSTMNRAGFADESRWTPIVSIRVAADVPAAERLPLEWMNTNSPAFLASVDEARNSSNPWYAHAPQRWGVCDPLVDVRLADQGGR